jgi:hypothetical protein
MMPGLTVRSCCSRYEKPIGLPGIVSNNKDGMSGLGIVFESTSKYAKYMLRSRTRFNSTVSDQWPSTVSNFAGFPNQLYLTFKMEGTLWWASTDNNPYWERNTVSIFMPCTGLLGTTVGERCLSCNGWLGTGREHSQGDLSCWLRFEQSSTHKFQPVRLIKQGKQMIV